MKSNALALICDRSVSALGPTPYGGFERVWTSACSRYRNPPLLHFFEQWCKMTIFASL